MQLGNWIPISKYFAKSLPSDRPFTELEAVYCLQLDYDAQKQVTIKGYSELWKWSRGKVTRFLDSLGIIIAYTYRDKNLKKQKGKLYIDPSKNTVSSTVRKTDIKRTLNGHKRLIDSRWLQK